MADLEGFHAENISAVIQNLDIDLWEVTHKQGHHEENISATVQNLEFALSEIKIIAIGLFEFWEWNPPIVQGETMQITANDFNRFNSYINELRNALSRPSVPYIEVTKGLQMMADELNTTIDNLQKFRLDEPLPTKAVSDETDITAEQLNMLKDYLNKVIQVVTESIGTIGAENISATIQNLDLDLWEVTHKKGYHEENISATVQNLTFTLTEVE